MSGECGVPAEPGDLSFVVFSPNRLAYATQTVPFWEPVGVAPTSVVFRVYDAASGLERWRTEWSPVEWSDVVLSDDGEHVAVVSTRIQTVVEGLLDGMRNTAHWRGSLQSCVAIRLFEHGRPTGALTLEEIGYTNLFGEIVSARTLRIYPVCYVFPPESVQAWVATSSDDELLVGSRSVIREWARAVKKRKGLTAPVFRDERLTLLFTDMQRRVFDASRGVMLGSPESMRGASRRAIRGHRFYWPRASGGR
jgi:hypothetical protein